jgi:hypothetical protein
MNTSCRHLRLIQELAKVDYPQLRAAQMGAIETTSTYCTKGLIMTDLIRISRIEPDMGVPFAPATLYKWAHLGKHAELFIKIGGALFLDRGKLEELIELSRCNVRRTRGTAGNRK